MEAVPIDTEFEENRGIPHVTTVYEEEVGILAIAAVEPQLVAGRLSWRGFLKVYSARKGLCMLAV